MAHLLCSHRVCGPSAHTFCGRECAEECIQHITKPGYTKLGGTREPLPYLEKYLKGVPICCHTCEGIPGGKMPVVLKICKCGKVAYCCREHQLKDWKNHKPACNGEKEVEPIPPDTDENFRACSLNPEGKMRDKKDEVAIVKKGKKGKKGKR